MAPYSGLRGFLHDDLGMLMIFLGFNGKYCTFSGNYGCISTPLSYYLAPFGLNAAGHMLEVVVIEVIDDNIVGTVQGIP